MPDVVRATDTRTTVTPNATMTTLASPTLGASSGLSVWRVEMRGHARGPLHRFDSEQIWTVLEGAVSFCVDGETAQLTIGDTLVVPAGVERQVTATSDARLLVCGHAEAVAHAVGEEAPRGTPAWIS